MVDNAGDDLVLLVLESVVDEKDSAMLLQKLLAPGKASVVHKGSHFTEYVFNQGKDAGCVNGSDLLLLD